MKQFLFNKIIFILSILTAIKFWSCRIIDFDNWGNSIPIILFFIYLLIIFNNKSKSNNDIMEPIVKWTLFVMAIGFIPAKIDYNQSFLYSIVGIIRWTFGLVFYFVLKRWNYDTNTIIKLLTPIVLIWVIIEIGQQFTYPEYWFNGRLPNEKGELGNRMGLWRFYIWGVNFVMLMMCYWFNKLINSPKITFKKLFLSISLIIGLLCYCSRKHIYITLIALLYSVLISSGKHKTKYIIIILLFFLGLVTLFYKDFSEMNMEANEIQGSGEDFIRYLAAKYFLTEFSDSPLQPITGTGIASGVTSDLFIRYEWLKNTFGFYTADIGILGFYVQHGILGITAILGFIIVFIRKWNLIDNWLKVYFIMIIFLIFFDFWGMWPVGIFSYSIFLYLTEKSIKKNSLNKVNN